MEFVISKRGKKMLIFESKFKYVFGYTSQTNVTRWRCFMKNCPAIILEKEKVLLETKGDHGDNCSVKNIDRQKLATTCKRKAVEDICQRPRKIILGEIQLLNLYNISPNNWNNCFLGEINAFGVSSTMTRNDISALRKCVYRARRQFLPTNPTCIADIHSAVSSVNTLTTNDEEFLLLNDDISNIIIFSCNTNLKM
ncbi:uncharacterized protein LOC115034263 [Acyrthosiphon pisum]|uniref:FLYWCH-type domain-containing protein n=1 Tax=Acyrthosiphon pisum TaxID=7029 RepID=A0A8R2JUB0_ACYPI|nr:uncharacterized protein LOC115034263 [Acyrthosiphon pisum]